MFPPGMPGPEHGTQCRVRCALVQAALTLKSAGDFELEKASRSRRTFGNIWENWKNPGE